MSTWKGMTRFPFPHIILTQLSSIVYNAERLNAFLSTFFISYFIHNMKIEGSVVLITGGASGASFFFSLSLYDAVKK